MGVIPFIRSTKILGSGLAQRIFTGPNADRLLPEFSGSQTAWLAFTLDAGCSRIDQTSSGEMFFPGPSLWSRAPHSSGDTPQRPDAGSAGILLPRAAAEGAPAFCSAGRPSLRCGRRRLWLRAIAASADSSPQRDHSAGSLTSALLRPRHRRLAALPPAPTPPSAAGLPPALHVTSCAPDPAARL